MALDSSKVNVAITGVVAYAPVSTPGPTSALEELDAAFVDVGYISEDGITEARERSTENIIAWQNADVVRTVTTEANISVSFTMIETNPNSLELFYGAPVAADGSIEIVPSSSGGRRSIVIDYVDGDKHVRMYMPEAEVTEVGEQTLASGEAVGYEVTITGYPSTDGWAAKKWFSDLDTTGS